MNKNIWLTAGIAGMLLCNPAADARSEVTVQISTGSRPSFVINSAPNFVYLRTQGFSVSVGSPYDIIYYRNSYYLYHNRSWYRSSNYQGPWMIILNKRLPYQIRRHHFDDIRRYRDVEARRSDHENNRYQRNDDNRRRLLDQRNESHNQAVERQQKSNANTRRVEGPPKQNVHNQKVEGQQKSNANTRRVEGPPKQNVHNQNVEGQQKNNANKKRGEGQPNKNANGKGKQNKSEKRD